MSVSLSVSVSLSLSLSLSVCACVCVCEGTCCKLLKTGYKGGAAPAMFPWVDGMWSSKHCDDPKKKEKKFFGASEGLSGALSGTNKIYIYIYIYICKP